MSYKDVTIVITSFNSENQIVNCLNSINRKIQTFVIENSNNQNFKTNIEKKYTNVKCFLTGENLGYAKGNNFGLKRVKTKYAIILNPDSQLSPDAVDNFLENSKKIPDFAMIGPFIQEQNELELSDSKIKKELIETQSLKGFALFLNMSQFVDIGFFDENFFIYFEEIDLCRRVRLSKKKIYLDPEIRIKHLGGSSHNAAINTEMDLSRNWHWMWSTFYYHKKYNGYIVSLIKIFPKLISAIFKTVFYSLIFNSKKRKIYFQRSSGILNSMMLKDSWYRPKIF